MKRLLLLAPLAFVPLVLAPVANGTIAPASTPASASERLSPDDDQLVTVDEAAARKFFLETAAKSHGITVESAVQQVDLQDRMDTLPFHELDPNYLEDGSTGLGNDFRLWYRSAGDPPAKLMEALRSLGVLEHLDIERVPYSYDQLSRKASDLQQELASMKVPVSLALNTALGGVTLYPLPSASSEDLAQARELSERAGLASVEEEAPTGMQIGGRDLSNDAPGDTRICTAAFVAKKDGDRAVLSAAHCGAYLHPFSYAGEAGYNAFIYSYDYDSDVNVIDKTSTSWTPQVKFNDGVQRDVNYTKGYAGVDVGDTVEKYGQITNYTQGEVVSKTACGAFGCSAASKFIRVERTYPSGGTNMCAPGDSGGPFMTITTALGILSARYSDGDCTFMSVGHVTEKIGWNIVTPSSP